MQILSKSTALVTLSSFSGLKLPHHLLQLLLPWSDTAAGEFHMLSLDHLEYDNTVYMVHTGFQGYEECLYILKCKMKMYFKTQKLLFITHVIKS